MPMLMAVIVIVIVMGRTVAPSAEWSLGAEFNYYSRSLESRVGGERIWLEQRVLLPLVRGRHSRSQCHADERAKATNERQAMEPNPSS